MNLDLIKKLCKIDTETLKSILKEFLADKGYRKIYTNDLYIAAEGDNPVCLIAHMDTVFSYPPKEFYYDQEKKVLWSPGGSGFDDRAGIYAIINIIETTDFRPSVLFLDKEEAGGIGARALTDRFMKCPFKKCNILIELDRANHNDAVFYDCDNEKFEQFIFKFGFKGDYGTFSDISVIAPIWKIAAVNLSIGYEDEHFGTERLHTDWCDETIKKVKKILGSKVPYFKYIPFKYSFTPMQTKGSNKLVPFSKNCAFCGKEFINNSFWNVTDYGAYSYALCDECYQLYYKGAF